jgi:predicted RNA-binding Zn-ribbon protein involved in translation (DUF1610 family)
MPWKCPACQTQIEHDANMTTPRPGVIYRCHVCRLELKLDPETNKLILAPLPDKA